MKLSDFRNSRFVTKDDCDNGDGGGLVGTIASVERDDVSPAGSRDPKMKPIVGFEESYIKPFVCNVTNAKTIARICGSEDTDDWIGHKIMLYHDPSVELGGDVVGGIRVRGVPAVEPEAESEFDDEVPF